MRWATCICVLVIHFKQYIMRKIVVFVLLLRTITLWGQEERYISSYFEFEPGGFEYLFANDVKLREAPDTKAKVIELLKFGSQVQIVSMAKETMMYDGIESHWYKVVANHKTGYVLGALIDMKTITASTGDLIHFQIKMVEENVWLKVRYLPRNGTEYIEKEFEMMGNEFEINKTNNKGLKGISNFILVEYIAEACGIEGGTTYLTWDGKNLNEFGFGSQVVDADVYSIQEEFIFPNDKEGRPDTVIFISEENTLQDEETEHWITIIEKMEYKWINGKLSPPFKPFETTIKRDED